MEVGRGTNCFCLFLQTVPKASSFLSEKHLINTQGYQVILCPSGIVFLERVWGEETSRFKKAKGKQNITMRKREFNPQINFKSYYQDR